MIARSEWTSTDANANAYTAFSQSGHAIRLDATAEHLEGPSPMEAVLMALCSCTSVDVVGILKKKRQPVASLTVSAEAEQAELPPRVFTGIKLLYTVRPEAGKQISRQALENAVALSKGKYCSVSIMLGESMKIECNVAFADGEPLP